MTKPANFPARKMQRRIVALSRLEGRVNRRVQLGIAQVASEQIELAALHRACGDIDTARAARTKKNRSDRASLRRA